MPPVPSYCRRCRPMPVNNIWIRLTAQSHNLNDSNIIATIHFYGLWPFSVNIAGYTKFDTDTINDITDFP